jgi:hypothetical protein
MKLEFFDGFVKDAQISNFMQICPVAAEMFHADGRTDRQTMKLIGTFRNFVNTPKNGWARISAGSWVTGSDHVNIHHNVHIKFHRYLTQHAF